MSPSGGPLTFVVLMMAVVGWLFMVLDSRSFVHIVCSRCEVGVKLFFVEGGPTNVFQFLFTFAGLTAHRY